MRTTISCKLGMNICGIMMQESGVPLASDQVQFSLLYRRHEKEGLLKKAKELGVSVIAYSPLTQGLLTGESLTALPASLVWWSLRIAVQNAYVSAYILAVSFFPLTQGLLTGTL